MVFCGKRLSIKTFCGNKVNCHFKFCGNRVFRENRKCGKLFKYFQYPRRWNGLMKFIGWQLLPGAGEGKYPFEGNAASPKCTPKARYKTAPEGRLKRSRCQGHPFLIFLFGVSPLIQAVFCSLSFSFSSISCWIFSSLSFKTFTL